MPCDETESLKFLIIFLFTETMALLTSAFLSAITPMLVMSSDMIVGYISTSVTGRINCGVSCLAKSESIFSIPIGSYETNSRMGSDMIKLAEKSSL